MVAELLDGARIRNRLISQYRQGDTTLDTLTREVWEVIEQQVIAPLQTLEEMRDIDSARGIWLDRIGRRIGLPRPLSSEEYDRLGFDGGGDGVVGFDQGAFESTSALLSGLRGLGDGVYRPLMRAAAHALITNGSATDIERCLRLAFPDAQKIEVAPAATESLTGTQDISFGTSVFYTGSTIAIDWPTASRPEITQNALKAQASDNRYLDRIRLRRSDGYVRLHIEDNRTTDASATGQELSTEFETDGRITLTVGGRSQTIDMGSDTTEPYEFTPSNAAEVISYANYLNGLGNNNATGTIQLGIVSSTDNDLSMEVTVQSDETAIWDALTDDDRRVVFGVPAGIAVSWTREDED